MIAAAFLVLLRPYSIQCVLLLLLLLLGTIATILFFCCWHRKLRNGKHPIKSVLSGRARSRVGLRTHHFRSEGFRHSPRHARRSIHARGTEEKPNLVEIPESEPDSSSTLRKRKVKKRVLPEFYQSVQVTPTRRPLKSKVRSETVLHLTHILIRVCLEGNTQLQEERADTKLQMKTIRESQAL